MRGLPYPSRRLLGLVLLSALASCAPWGSDLPESATEGAAPVSASTSTPLMPAVATPSPMPRSIRLTEPGCCAHAWWSDEGDRIRFIDDPPGESPQGVYSVSPTGGEIRRDGPDSTEAEDILALRPEVELERLYAAVPDEARALRTSPDGNRIAWTTGTSSVSNVDLRQRAVWSADYASGSTTAVATVVGGDLIGWTSDGLHLVVSGAFLGDRERGLWSLPLDGSAPRLLLPAERIRSAVLSPAGGWVVLYRAFESDPTQNGVWLVEADGDRRARIPGLASYRWRDERRLLFFPYERGEALTLMEFDVEAESTRRVAGPEAFLGGIAANDWSVSPTGAWMVYRSADDGSLWSLELEGL